MAGIDADGFPVAGHGCLVPAPLQLGAVQRVFAQIQQAEAQGFPWRQAEGLGNGLCQACFKFGVGAMNCGFGHGCEVQAQAGAETRGVKMGDDALREAADLAKGAAGSIVPLDDGFEIGLEGVLRVARGGAVCRR